MHRNLDRRVEALVQLVQPDHMQEIEALFDLAMSEEASSWRLGSDGVWTRHKVSATGGKLVDVQDEVMRRISAKRGRN
jgi:polyphosphate kinase